MKIALVLLVVGLFLGLFAPFLWGESISIISVTLPQPTGSKSPPTIVEVSGTTGLRMAGAFFVFLSALCFILFRENHGTRTGDASEHQQER